MAPELTDRHAIRLNKLIGMVEELLRSNQEELEIEIVEVSKNSVPKTKHEHYLLQGMIVSCVDKGTGNFTYLNIDIDSPSDRTPVVEEGELQADETSGSLPGIDGQPGERSS